MSFQIEQVAVPPRKLPNAGPRASKYPVDEIIEAGVGYGFGVSVKDEKEGRQRQSQFASLAKSRGVRFATRVILSEDDNPFTTVNAPLLGVWYNGPRTAADPVEEAAAEAVNDLLDE